MEFLPKKILEFPIPNIAFSYGSFYKFGLGPYQSNETKPKYIEWDSFFKFHIHLHYANLPTSVLLKGHPNRTSPATHWERIPCSLSYHACSQKKYCWHSINYYAYSTTKNSFLTSLGTLYALPLWTRRCRVLKK